MTEKRETISTRFKQVVIFIIIFAFILPMTTAFAYESQWDELPEIEPFYFDHAMISQVSEISAFASDFHLQEDQLVDLSLVSMSVNELTELSPEELRYHQRAQGIYWEREAHAASIEALDSGIQDSSIPPLLPTPVPDTPPNFQYVDIETFMRSEYAEFEQIMPNMYEEMDMAELEELGIVPASAAHEEIIENPFGLHFNANDSVTLNTGASAYRVPILHMPGRNGHDLTLSLRYDSSNAIIYEQWPSITLLTTRPKLYGLVTGWKLDLPYISNSLRAGVPGQLYLPGRGSFTLYRFRFQDHRVNDMSIYNDFSFTSGTLRSSHRLVFYNGMTYFFHYSHILGKVDRFGNTIRFEYTHVPGENDWHLSHIIDTNGQVITFTYQESGIARTIVITAPDQSTFTINMSRTSRYPAYAAPVFQVDSVLNQVGAMTAFTYELVRFYTQYCSARGIWLQNYTVLLRQVLYPSGGALRFYYQSYRIGQHHVQFATTYIFRVNSRVVLGNSGREYSRTTFQYLRNHRTVNFTFPIPPQSYGVTVTQNNGLSTFIEFSPLHLKRIQRQYNAAGVRLSELLIAYNDRRLPSSFTMTEFRDGLSRTHRQELSYNLHGQIIQSISPQALGSPHERYRTNYTFDPRFGLLLARTTRPDAQTTVVERNTLSADGRHIIRTYIYENNVRRSRTDFLHDNFGNVTEIRQFPNAMAANFITTQIVYASGTLPQSIRTTGVRDAEGRPVGGNGIVQRSFTYDQMWRVLSETDPNGYVTRWEYDRLGRVTRITFPNGGFVTYAYNDQLNTLTYRTVLGAVYTHQFDRLGNLLTITAPGGVVIQSNTYDNRMRLIETRNAQGIASSQRITFAYDIFDRIIEKRYLNSVGAAMAVITTDYTDIYNAAGNSRVLVTAHGNANAPSIQTFSMYDRFGRRIQEGVVGGRITNYTFDLAGRVTQEQSLGIDNTFTHNVFGITSVRNIEARTSHTTHDSMGRVATVSDFAGNVQQFRHDESGRLISHRIPFERVGNVVQYAETRYFYDNNGNLIRTASLINAPGAAQIWAGTENTFRHNRLIASLTGGVSGIRVEYTYDLAGNILTMRSGDAVTSYTYNNRGQLIQTRDALGQVESFTYDNNGLLLTRTDRNGTQFRMTYDNMGRLIQEDAVSGGTVAGRRTYSFNPTGSLLTTANGSHTITYRYDAQGRLIRQDETGGIVKTLSYNAANNVVQSRIYVNGAVHINNTYTFDAAQRVHTVRASGTLTATYAYDANGNRTRVTLGNGTVTDYTFNLANLVTNVTNRHGNTTLSSFAYLHYLDDNVRKVIEYLEGERREIIYTYDLARRLVREYVTLLATAAPTRINISLEDESPEIALPNYEFESNVYYENQYEELHYKPYEYLFEEQYDDYSETQNLPCEEIVESHNNVYDIVPFIIRYHEEWSVDIRIVYRDAGGTIRNLPKTVHVNLFSPDISSWTWSYEFAVHNGTRHHNGNQKADWVAYYIRETSQSGIIWLCCGFEAITVDVTNYLHRWVTISPSTWRMHPGQSLQFSAMARGSTNPLQSVSWEIEGNNSALTQITTSGLLTVAENETSPNITIRAIINNMPRIYGTTVVTVSHSAIREYTFDDRGNRASMTFLGFSESYTITYTYDLNNRLLSSTRTGSNPQTTTYTYDRNGNQLTATTGVQTETRTYNAFNQLTRVTRPAAPNSPAMTATYTYRADNLRHCKTVNNARTQHVWNGMHIVLERNANGAVINRFDRGSHGNLLRSQHHGWYLFNFRGDVVQRVGNQGNILHEYQYDAFGNEISYNQNNTNPFRFASMYWDSHTQTYMTPNRHFSPRTGRWTQPDPHWSIGNMIFGDNPRRMNEREDPLGLNLYTMVPDVWAIMQAGNLYVFCGNNPIMFVDPTGLFWKLVIKALESPPAKKAMERVDTAAKWVGDQAVKGARWVGDTVSGWFNRGGGQAAQQAAPVFKSPTQHNFRYNLQQLTGQSGTGMQAHHVLPQADRFAHHFKRTDLNIHEPRFGSWVETAAHQSWSHNYNARWDAFFAENPLANVQQILDYARTLANYFRFIAHF